MRIILPIAAPSRRFVISLLVSLLLLLSFPLITFAGNDANEETCSSGKPAELVADEPSTAGTKMSTTERTFIAVKPDGVQRGLVGKIVARFEERGYKLVAAKMVHASKEHLEVHYQDLKEKPFFPGLIEYMRSGPVFAMVWEGLDAVKQGRSMLGATNPLQSAPGTIRGDFCLQTGRNICHGSDSVESANREIAHWFKPEELVSYKFDHAAQLYE